MKIGTRKVRKCACCGQRVECEWNSNPYAADVHNDGTPMWICDNCAKQSADDI